MIEISKALTHAIKKLESHTDARLDAELLLCHILEKERVYLYAHPEHLISLAQATQFQQLIQQRALGFPIAYLTGQREFWSLLLKVNQHTLIPRHETERLVELALELLPNEPHISVLDLGTGSGAIALALAKERPNWDVHGSEKSQEALNIAMDNAKNLGIKNISWHLSDWFTKLSPSYYHAIISNPPYIAPSDPHLTQGDLRFEPLHALASGQDGLADLQYIINQSPQYLRTQGLLLLEHGFDQKMAVSSILNRIGYKNIHCWQDMLGQDRVSGGWFKK